jgi:hypothetical protein
MQSMAMTPEETRQFNQLKQDVEELKDNWAELNGKIDKILSLVKGIAIGVAIGAVIFGLLSVKDFLSMVK